MQSMRYSLGLGAGCHFKCITLESMSLLVEVRFALSFCRFSKWSAILSQLVNIHRLNHSATSSCAQEVAVCNQWPEICLSELVKRSAKGLIRDLNPGPLAPKARIIPLDQRALDKNKIVLLSAAITMRISIVLVHGAWKDWTSCECLCYTCEHSSLPNCWPGFSSNLLYFICCVFHILSS